MSIWQADVARARWRADLLEYTAAGLDSIGHTADAEAKQAKAVRNRAFADLVETYETAVAGLDRKSSEFGLLRNAFADARRAARASRDPFNPEVGMVNNFSEPSDDELLGGAS